MFSVWKVYYMLGDCCLDAATKRSRMSFVIGFGPKWPASPHHRSSSCNGTSCSCTTLPNVHTLWGALVGGPDAQDGLSSAGCPDFILQVGASSLMPGLMPVTEFVRLCVYRRLRRITMPGLPRLWRPSSS
jgi:hypothetical protein